MKSKQEILNWEKKEKEKTYLHRSKLRSNPFYSSDQFFRSCWLHGLILCHCKCVKTLIGWFLDKICLKTYGWYVTMNAMSSVWTESFRKNNLFVSPNFPKNITLIQTKFFFSPPILQFSFRILCMFLNLIEKQVASIVTIRMMGRRRVRDPGMDSTKETSTAVDSII